MCDGILIRLPGGDICIPIYRQQVQWPPKGPGPDPFRHLLDEIAIIATINDAVAHLSNGGVRSQLGQAVQGALKTIAHQLPAGVSVGEGLLRNSLAN